MKKLKQGLALRGGPDSLADDSRIVNESERLVIELVQGAA
jgi:hypothetical protein